MHGQNNDNTNGAAKEAFEVTYRAYAGALYGIACRLAPNEEVAGQILTGAFVSCFQEGVSGRQIPPCLAQLTAAVFNSAMSILKAYFSVDKVSAKIRTERERLLSRLRT